MTRIARRTFGTLALLGAPLLVGFSLSARADVAVGVSTYSYRDLFRVPGQDNVDDVIRALRASGATGVELAAVNVEPAGPNTGPAAPPRPAAYPVQAVVQSPAQVAAMKAAVRDYLRRWRTTTPDAWFQQVRERLYAENFSILAYAVEFDADFTDAEVDAAFRHAKLLGASTVSSRMTLAVAVRVAPFAVRHAMSLAIHTQPDGNTGRFISTADLDAALALSPALTLKLDIGHATASNRDAVAVLRQYLDRVSSVNVQDRLRNGGRSERFGDGDTPIAAALTMLRGSARAVPVFVEYSYSGLGSSAAEVRESVLFLKSAAN